MNNIVCYKNIIMAPLACAFYFFALKSSKRAKKPALLHLKSVLPKEKEKNGKRDNLGTKQRERDRKLQQCSLVKKNKKVYCYYKAGKASRKGAFYPSLSLTHIFLTKFSQPFTLPPFLLLYAMLIRGRALNGACTMSTKKLDRFSRKKCSTIFLDTVEKKLLKC